MTNSFSAIGENISIWVAFLAWLVAQSVKFIRHGLVHHEMDFRFFVSTGGMPSAHSAAVSAMATSIGVRAGWDSPVFAVASIFALVVMFDAQSVRRAAGQQARILNQIVAELFKEHHLSKNKLAELLGHTRLEVGAGLLLGVVMALLIHQL